MRAQVRKVALREFEQAQLARWIAGVLLLPLLAAFVACGSSTPKRPIPVSGLSSDFNPLRSQFNRDAGKVRLVILLDPT